MLASPAATGIVVVDGFYRGLLATVVASAAVVAPPAALVVVGGVAASVFAAHGVGAAGVGLVALGAGVVAVERHADSATARFASGALSAQLLLRQPSWGTDGASAALAAALFAAIIVLGYRRATPPAKRVVRRVALGSATLVVVATAPYAVLAARAAGELEDALAHAGAAAAAVRESRSDRAVEATGAARTALGAARAALAAGAGQPAAVVPGVGRVRAVAARVVDAAGDLARSAGRAGDLLELRTLDLDRESLERLDASAGALAAVERDADRLADELHALRDEWLLEPVDRATRPRAEAVVELAGTVERAGAGARLLPDLLGASTPRKYLVAFTTPAETRGLGGLFGNWAELHASGGELRLDRTGRAIDLHPKEGEERVLVASEDYRRRYGLLRPERTTQDVTFAPDLPSVATVLESVYRQATGRDVDGTVLVDPHGVAALLAVAGPVSVPGGRVLTSDTVVDFLLREQYADHPVNEERTEVLDALLRQAFEHLVDGSPPVSVGAAIAALGPVVAEQRLAISSNDADEQRTIEALGLGAVFPRRGDGDLLGLVTQNAANSKLDAYLHREMSIDVRDAADVPDGRVAVTVDVRLRSDTPPDVLDLPSRVLGGSASLPVPATNRVEVSLYTPHRVVDAQVDGRSATVRSATELGVRVHSVLVDVPPSGAAAVRMRLSGHALVTRPYELLLVAQPVANTDRVTVHADVGGRRIEEVLLLRTDRRLRAQ